LVGYGKLIGVAGELGRSAKEGFVVASLWVTIPTAGAWPAPAELKARNTVTDALTAAGIGTCTGSGGGGGEMDFSFRVSDEQAARAAIDSAMQAHMPGVSFRVRVSE
jgi:hypothetical protein